MTHQPNNWGCQVWVLFRAWIRFLLQLVDLPWSLQGWAQKVSVAGMQKTAQWGKGLFCSALGTFPHANCCTPHWGLCFICSSPFVSFREAFHNVHVAATARKGHLSPSPLHHWTLAGLHVSAHPTLGPGPWLEQAGSAQGHLGTSPAFPAPANSVGRVSSLGNHCFTS